MREMQFYLGALKRNDNIKEDIQVGMEKMLE